jgi:hypothetical protein
MPFSLLAGDAPLPEISRERLMNAMDAVNRYSGAGTIRPASASREVRPASPLGLHERNDQARKRITREEFSLFCDEMERVHRGAVMSWFLEK